MTGIIKNSEFSPLTSVTGYALKGIYQWKGKENVSAFEKGARFVISEIGFVSLALLATVEAVIRPAISLLVKLVHYLIPENKSEWFTKHIYKPTVEASKYTALQRGLQRSLPSPILWMRIQTIF